MPVTKETEPTSLERTSTKEIILGEKIKKVVDEVKLGTKNFIQGSSEQDKVLQFSRELARTKEGMGTLYRLMPLLMNTNIFSGGGWEREDKLLPSLVRGSFLAKGIYPTIESLSELRMLAIASGKVSSSRLTKEEAHQFLIEVLALNLDFLFGTDTEESRNFPHAYQKGKALFSFIADNIDLSDLFNEFVSEIGQLCAQRPIITTHISKLIKAGEGLIEANPELKGGPDYALYEKFHGSIFAPTPLSAENSDYIEYRKALVNLDDKELEKEAHKLGTNILFTGLASPHASVLLRYLSKRKPSLIPLCLNLNETGFVHFEKNEELILRLIRMCIRPSTSHCIYGFGRFLERNLLSQRQVKNGLLKLVEIDILPNIQSYLLRRRLPEDSITPNALLVSGLIAVLGQPLGVGQGNNPTCQSARGISLWSQHDPGHLIEMTIIAVRNGLVEMTFEGVDLKSSTLLPLNYFSEETPQDPNLDVVSLILNPHLDAIYNYIISLTGGRGEDGHKWVNPAFYGSWVSKGFDSVLDYTQTYVKSYYNFVRRFYATHHPEFNDHNVTSYANPVGIFVTSSHGDLIGLHAVSIQRVKADDKGVMRVYFYNPNNEGRQNWGQGIFPTVSGHGEKKGESSLPFYQFTSRLYAFHFDPYEEGDGFAVPREEVNKVSDLSKNSWGRSYQWLE